jgi:hypothetical protein
MKLEIVIYQHGRPLSSGALLLDVRASSRTKGSFKYDVPASGIVQIELDAKYEKPATELSATLSDPYGTTHPAFKTLLPALAGKPWEIKLLDNPEVIATLEKEASTKSLSEIAQEYVFEGRVEVDQRGYENVLPKWRVQATFLVLPDKGPEIPMTPKLLEIQPNGNFKYVTSKSVIGNPATCGLRLQLLTADGSTQPTTLLIQGKAFAGNMARMTDFDKQVMVLFAKVPALQAVTVTPDTKDPNLNMLPLDTPGEVITPIKQNPVVTLTTTAKTRVMKGRAIDKAGEPIKNVPLIIHAERPTAGTKEKMYQPILATKTDGTGNFVVNAPVENFNSAFATLAIAVDKPIEIVLSSGQLPEFTLLVADTTQALTHADHEGCGCKDKPNRLPEMEDLLSPDSNYQQDIGGSCVNFTTPNRALEEFSFNTVVRNTDPEVMNAPGYVDNLNVRIKELEKALAEAKKQQTASTTTTTTTTTGNNTTNTTNTNNAAQPPAPFKYSPVVDELEIFVNELQNTIDPASFAPHDYPDMVSKRLINIRQSFPNGNETLGRINYNIPRGAFVPKSSMVSAVRGILAQVKDLEDKKAKLSGNTTTTTGNTTTTQVVTPPITPNTDKISVNTDWMEMELTRLKKELAAAMERTNVATMRKKISINNQIQWDAPMPLVQPASIAHGHLLNFRQVWRADGYSTGDLLYSLPLAPGQQKQIVIHDWDRKETASRSESQSMEDSLSNSLAQDRDINEIVNSSLKEDISGHSKAESSGKSSGFGGALGAGAEIPVGGVPVNVKVGFSGGMSKSKGKSESWADQKSSRDVSANTMQNVREKTMQSASSVRSQRSTVVTSMSQSESTNITTESIANYNHCHAITIQYFEVLRHLAVHIELADVQECLFIPLTISLFDDAKVCRWSDILRVSLRAPRSKYERLMKGFDAIRRYYDINAMGKAADDVYYNVPAGRYCDEKITEISGSFRVKINFGCPKKSLKNLDGAQADIISKIAGNGGLFANGITQAMGHQSVNQFLIDQNADRTLWETQLGFIREIEDIRYKVNNVSDDRREAVFQAELMRVNAVAQFAKYLQISLGTPNLTPINSRVSLTRSGNLKSAKLNGEAPAYDFAFRSVSNSFSLERDQIQNLGISTSWTNALPEGSTLKLEHVQASYENKYITARLCNGYPSDDLLSGAATMTTPMQQSEMVSPRSEDLQLRHELLDHFNCNMEYYHKAIWVQMDEDRRLMLLEGFEIEVPARENPAYNPANPQSREPKYLYGDDPNRPDLRMRSVASVVENRLIGIAGNSLIMPVAKGYNLNPVFRYAEDEVEIDGRRVSKLMSYYMPEKGFKDTPFRISIPTKGVFAESVMGACNSCEKIDNTRYWKWEEHPIPLTPTAIDPVSADSRRAEALGLTPSGFEPSLISQQQGNKLPDPTGMAAAFDLLKANSFNNITGLEGNQKNALEAMRINAEAAQEYAKTAADLAKSMEIPKNGDAVADSIRKNVKDPKKAQEMIEQYYQNMVGGDKSKGGSTNGGGGGNSGEQKQPGALEKAAAAAIQGAQGAAKGRSKVVLPDGTTVETEHEGGAPGVNADLTLDRFPSLTEEEIEQRFEFMLHGENFSLTPYMPDELQGNPNDNINSTTIA